MSSELANLIRATASARESSFDHIMATVMKESYERKLEGYVGNPLNVMRPDFNKCYQLSLLDSAKAVCPPEMVQPVYLLLTYSWNDILDWAEGIING